MLNDTQNKNMEYPVDKDSTSKMNFVDKLEKASNFQKQNPTQIQKSAFYEQDARGKKVFQIQLSDQLFKGCLFNTATIIRCVFDKCTFIDCDFSAASIFNVKFTQCTFRNCKFVDTQMQDVDASSSSKSNCTITNVDLSRNVKGFNEQDSSIIQDSVQDINKPETSSVYAILKQVLTDWKQVQPMSFELVGQDQNCGLAIYPNAQKNGDVQTDIWQFAFFYGSECVLMNDNNLFGMTSEQIAAIVDRWINVDLVQQSQTIIKNILSIINQK